MTVNSVNELDCPILRFLLQFEHGAPPCFCVQFRMSKGGLTTFRKLCGDKRKDGFPDFRCVHVGKRHRICLWCEPFICWSVGLALVTVVFFLSHEASTQKPLKIKRRSG